MLDTVDGGVLRAWPNDDKLWFAKNHSGNFDAHIRDLGNWEIRKKVLLYVCMDGRLSLDLIKQQVHQLLQQDMSDVELEDIYHLSSPGGNIPLFDALAYQILARLALARRVRWNITHMVFVPHDREQCAGAMTGLGMGPKEGQRMSVAIHKATRLIYPGIFDSGNGHPKLVRIRVKTNGSLIAKIGTPPPDDLWDNTEPFVLNAANKRMVMETSAFAHFLPL